MRWLEAALAALLHAPVLALLALSIGLGQRFGARNEVWGGAAAAAAAVGAAAFGSISGLGSMANATLVVPAVFCAAYLLGVFITTRPEVTGDQTRSFTASALVATAVIGLLVVLRGDDPVAFDGSESVWKVLGGPVVSAAAVFSAVVACAAVVVLAVVVTMSRFRVRLVVMDRAPALLQRAGHDARHVSALFAALTASAGALGGVLASRQQDVAPTGAVQLTMLGAEVALLGGLGSIPGALGAATTLALVSGLGNEFRAGWGTLAGHVLVLAVIALRQGNVGRWSASSMELAR